MTGVTASCEWTSPERVDVATMGRDVVEVGGVGVVARSQTVHTPGMLSEMGCAELAPACGVVEATDVSEGTCALSLAGVRGTVATRDTNSATRSQAEPKRSRRLHTSGGEGRGARWWPRSSNALSVPAVSEDG